VDEGESLGSQMEKEENDQEEQGKEQDDGTG
jgi:hypothetical protein